MMVTTDTHDNCNRQAGLIFMSVRLVLDLVASDEKFRRCGRAPGHPTGLSSMCLTTNRHFGRETLMMVGAG